LIEKYVVILFRLPTQLTKSSGLSTSDSNSQGLLTKNNKKSLPLPGSLLNFKSQLQTVANIINSVLVS